MENVSANVVQQSFNVWVHYGFTGLYVFFSLTVMTWLAYKLNYWMNQYVKMLAVTTQALANSASSHRHTAYVMDEIKNGLDANTQETARMRAYLQTRDAVMKQVLSSSEKSKRDDEETTGV